MEVTASEILEEGRRLIARTWLVAALYVIGGTTASTISDLPGWERGGSLASTAVGLALGYMLVTTMVEKAEVGRGNLAGFWAYFGLGIVTTLGIGLGVIALIIPGVFLWVRWSAAYGFLCVEGAGVMESLRSSFELTRGSFWQILVALLIPTVLALGAIAALVIWTETDGSVGLPASIGTNLAISVAGLLTTAIGLAVYSLKSHPSAQLDAVFA